MDVFSVPQMHTVVHTYTHTHTHTTHTHTHTHTHARCGNEKGARNETLCCSVCERGECVCVCVCVCACVCVCESDIYVLNICVYTSHKLTQMFFLAWTCSLYPRRTQSYTPRHTHTNTHTRKMWYRKGCKERDAVLQCT